MRIIVALLALLLITEAHSSEQLRAADSLASPSANLSPYEYAQLIAESQTEVLRKVVLHFLNSELAAILKTRSASSAK